MAKREHGQKTPFERLKEAADPVAASKSPLKIPVPVEAEPVDLWQIVVVGNIDLRQHHPQWYHNIECISDEELTSAKKSLTAVVMPVQAGMPPQASHLQFDVGAFAVIAIHDKWIIQTSSAKNRDRLSDVASVVFAKLWEISITAYGINRNWTMPLDHCTANQFLADRLAATDLALPQGKADGQVVFTQHLGESDTTYQLMPYALNERWLLVTHNRHHPIRPQDSFLGPRGYFDLGKLIKENVEADWQMASQYRSELQQCIVRAERN